MTANNGSQSLPNQVNDFNRQSDFIAAMLATMSQSLPNQVNDFNTKPGQTCPGIPMCRNPFQTRSTTSMWVPKPLPVSTLCVAIPSKPGQRLQFFKLLEGYMKRTKGVAIPSKPGQRLQSHVHLKGGDPKMKVSQSLPNQVNDFNLIVGLTAGYCRGCRNPFQTRSTTSMKIRLNWLGQIAPSRNPFQTRSTTSIGSTKGGRGH